MGVEGLYEMNSKQDELDRLSEVLYERYAKPLEAERRGEYIAVSWESDTLLGTDLEEVSLSAMQRLGKGGFVFKIGEKAVGKLRVSAAPLS